MVAVRALILVPAILLAVMSTDSLAKDKAQGRGNQGRGQGPAFCRSGQGHPVYGWQWCEDHGWGRGAYGNQQRNRDVRRDDRNGNQYPNIYRDGRRGNVAFDRGYSDGYEKGLEDASRNRDFDPTRHGWYRSADRGYDSGYGTKAEYQNIYRDGFRDGYNAGYNDRYRNTPNSGPTGSTGGARRRWPI
jgi:hypothetical protein